MPLKRPPVLYRAAIFGYSEMRGALVARSHPTSLFDPETFLSQIAIDRTVSTFRKNQIIYSQGEPADAVLYIQSGTVKLSAVSEHGREAVLAVLNAHDFFGEGCIVGQPVRLSTATAVTASSVMEIKKREIVRVLHEEHAFSDRFVSHLVLRNLRLEEDLVDQLFNSSEKRLARVLLLLAHFGKEGPPELVIPKISQETLAAMVGTTRSRINLFMNRFKKLGYIDYDGGLRVHRSLLTLLLH
jgi:CRP/FNR family transcriptional regulator, cyclic AMP receptor protein